MKVLDEFSNLTFSNYPIKIMITRDEEKNKTIRFINNFLFSVFTMGVLRTYRKRRFLQSPKLKALDEVRNTNPAYYGNGSMQHRDELLRQCRTENISDDCLESAIADSVVAQANHDYKVISRGNVQPDELPNPEFLAYALSERRVTKLPGQSEISLNGITIVNFLGTYQQPDIIAERKNILLS